MQAQLPDSPLAVCVCHTCACRQLLPAGAQWCWQVHGCVAHDPAQRAGLDSVDDCIRLHVSHLGHARVCMVSVVASCCARSEPRHPSTRVLLPHTGPHTTRAMMRICRRVWGIWSISRTCNASQQLRPDKTHCAGSTAAVPALACAALQVGEDDRHT